MKLYDYFRSSASFRIRIALNLKNISYESIAIHLIKDGGQQHQSQYLNINPQGLIPALALDDSSILTQSLAILEYLEEIYATPALLPKDPIQKAHVRAIANIVACDIHPLNNLRVLKYLKNSFGISEDQKDTWYKHWITDGFESIEALLPKSTTLFSFDDTPNLADVCLIPQIFNAVRFKCEMSVFPTLQKIYQNAISHPAIYKAFPENQADAE
jgi:maleylacetoacetate isomerase